MFKMRFSTALIALAAPFLVSAAPVKRIAAGDLAVLQFADVLEQLESTFYSQALQKFKDSDFLAAGFTSAQIPIQQFTLIGSDEATHSTALQGAIKANGGQPITNCKFDFSSVLTDVTTMAATARLVENVGVGAYLGASALLSDPALLTAAASILTVEARHQTMLNVLNGATSIPQAFDIALTPPQVLALAGPFVSGCDLGVTPNPSLAVTNTGAIQPGTLLAFNSTAINSTVSDNNLFCQMLAGGMPVSLSLPLSQCVVPQGINGPVAIFVTSDSQPLDANIVQQAPDSIVAGPTMAFIDTQSDDLSQSVNPVAGKSINGTSSGASAGNSSVPPSTTTISPSQASSIIASASTISLNPGVATAAVSTATGSSISPSASPSATGIPPSNAAGSGPASVPQPILFTGPSPDGHVTVNGWTNLPPSVSS
jgi:hypothetical protein